MCFADPLELGLGQVIQPLHFYPNPEDAPSILPKINKQIQEADGFLVIASEYNSAISPALCSIMDHFPPVSYAYRPSTSRVAETLACTLVNICVALIGAIITYSMGKFAFLIRLYGPVSLDILSMEHLNDPAD